MTGLDEPESFRRSAATVFLVSWSVIHLQLSLMRLLSVTRWHHFSYLVISTALLGYALSGSILQVAGSVLRKHYGGSQFWIPLSAAVLGGFAFTIAQKLPIDSQYLFSSTDQIGLFALYIVLLLVPFLLCAGCVGLSLMHHPERSSSLYAVSLLGTAAGGLAAILLMYRVAEEPLCRISFLIAAAGSAVWLGKSMPKAAALGAAMVISGYFVAFPMPLIVEPFKALSRMTRWEEQGDASHVRTLQSPRGRLDVFASPLLHFTLFAGLGARQGPPPQLCILRDGSFAGTVYQIGSPEQASILDFTPSSLAYRLRPGATVLLLGETGGINVWLARRHHAARIVVVQQDPQIIHILRDLLPPGQGRVLDGPDVDVVRQEPRLFLESTTRSFDVIQIVSAEEMAAETRGATGLSGDYVLTTEGLRAAWLRLAPHGILTVTRGIQIPQRDVFKLTTTLTEALHSASITDPGRHVILARNYLANLLLAFREPLTSSELSAVHKQILDLGLNVDWPRELAEPAPTGRSTAGSAGGLPSTTDAAARLFSDSAEQFIRGWMYDIRPATDDRPYFRDFFRVRSIGWMKKVYRDQWYQRVELGFAILLLTLVEVILLAAFVLLIPAFLWWKRERGLSTDSRRGPPLGRTLLYFFLIGIGFMALEINCIARAEILVGDPVFSATLVISVLLAGAGIGSALSARFPRTTQAVIRALLGVLVLIMLLSLLSAPSLPWLASLSLPERGAIVAVFLLPLGLFLGFFFPVGLRVVRSRSESLVPWAWGANGFASVAGPPLVTVIAMSIGHQAVFGVAAVSYLVAVLILPRQSQG